MRTHEQRRNVRPNCLDTWRHLCQSIAYFFTNWPSCWMSAWPLRGLVNGNNLGTALTKMVVPRPYKFHFPTMDYLIHTHTNREENKWRKTNLKTSLVLDNDDESPLMLCRWACWYSWNLPMLLAESNSVKSGLRWK